MAKIIIRKGFLSQGGKLHKAGDVVNIANATAAKRLVARSGGDFDFYHEPIISEEDTPTTEPEVEEVGAVSEPDTENATGDGLPAINATEAVKTFGGKGGKDKK